MVSFAVFLLGVSLLVGVAVSVTHIVHDARSQRGGQEQPRYQDDLDGARAGDWVTQAAANPVTGRASAQAPYVTRG